MSKFGPKTFLTAPVWDWGPMYVYFAKKVGAGTFTGEDVWWGMDKGIVDIAPIGPMVPASVKAQVSTTRTAMIRGTFNEFAGPIKDQTGKVRVAAGSALGDGEQLSM